MQFTRGHIWRKKWQIVNHQNFTIYLNKMNNIKKLTNLWIMQSNVTKIYIICVHARWRDFFFLMCYVCNLACTSCRLRACDWPTNTANGLWNLVSSVQFKPDIKLLYIHKYKSYHHPHVRKMLYRNRKCNNILYILVDAKCRQTAIIFHFPLYKSYIHVQYI